MQKKGLGRGINALIPTYDADEDEVTTLPAPRPQPRVAEVTENVPRGTITGSGEIELSKIDVNPNQPRKTFDDASLGELAQSIKTHGVLQPITVVKNKDRYMIVSGERRFRASQKAGLKTIPAQIKEYTAREIQELALIENLQRDDLTPVEVARGFQELMDEHGFTQDMLATRLGVNRTSVAHHLRLLTLDDKVLDMLDKGVMSMGHAKVICTTENKKMQEMLAIMVAKHGLSVRQLEQEVKKSMSAKNKSKESAGAGQSTELKELTKQIQRVFGTRVSCLGTDKKGRFIVEYYNRDDLDRIHEVISKIK